MTDSLQWDLVARFWSKVDIPSHRYWRTACWLWTGGQNKGYGQFAVVDSTITAAHRWAFRIMHGTFPDAEAGHTCHNALCVNPNHLKDSTRLENEQDKDAAGRRPRGVKNLPCPKCGGPQEGRSKRDGGREFAYCIPCRRAYNAEYARRRRS